MRRASTGSSAVGDLHAQLRERAQVFDCLRYPLAPLPEVESGLYSRRRSVTRLKVSNRYSGDGGTCMLPALPLLLEGSPAGSSGRARRQRCRSSPRPCPGVHRAGCVHPRVPEPDRLGGTVQHDSDSAGVLVAALVAAVSLDPGLLAPMRRAYDRSQERLEHDGLDVASATTVRLASTDGGSPPSCSFARRPVTCTERLARFLRRWPHERPPRADLPRRRDCMDPTGSATPTGVRDGRATGHQRTARR